MAGEPETLPALIDAHSGATVFIPAGSSGLTAERTRRRGPQHEFGLCVKGMGQPVPICPCCSGSFETFLPFGVVPRLNAQCPGCGCLERHRLLWLFLQERTGFFTDRLRVLHIAPEPAYLKAFRKMPNLVYVTADLRSPDAMVLLDLANIPAAADAFDAILCIHVLEHILDDLAAMREFRRVLAPGGWAILQVPLNEHLASTIEDPSVTSSAERQRLFGESDHVRLYGRDYHIRLEQAGFDVTADKYAYELPAELVARYSLLPEDIYLCRACPRIPREGGCARRLLS